MLTICLLLPFVPSGLVLTASADSRPVHQVGEWNALKTVLLNNSYKDIRIELTADITLDGSRIGSSNIIEVYAIAIMNNVEIDGKGHSIIFPDNMVLTRNFTDTSSHGGVGLFGAMYNCQLKNIEFKMEGDVYVGQYQLSTYDSFNPDKAFDIGYVGLVASTMGTNTVVENVSIVSEASNGTFYVKIGDFMRENTQRRMSAGLLAGVVQDNVKVSGVYIDANIEAGVHAESDTHYPEISVGGMFGRYYPKEEGSDQTLIKDFMVQGEVTAFTGSPTSHNAGGIIGMLFPDNTVGHNPNHSYGIKFEHGLVDVETNAYRINPDISTWPNSDTFEPNDYGLISAAYVYDDGWLGNTGINGSVTAEDVHVIFNSETPNSHKILTPVGIVETSTFNNVGVFDGSDAWVDVTSGSLHDGNIALKWLVNPVNEGVTLTKDLNATASGWDDNTLILSSANLNYATKGSDGYTYDLTGTVNAKGYLGMVQGITVTRNPVGVDQNGIVVSPLSLVDDGDGNMVETEYIAGGTYYFRANLVTTGISSVDPASGSDHIEESDIEWSLTQGGNPFTDEKLAKITNGKLEIFPTFMKTTKQELTVVAKITTANNHTEVIGTHPITIQPVEVSDTTQITGSQYNAFDEYDNPKRNGSLYIPITFNLNDTVKLDDENFRWKLTKEVADPEINASIFPAGYFDNTSHNKVCIALGQDALSTDTEFTLTFTLQLREGETANYTSTPITATQVVNVLADYTESSPKFNNSASITTNDVVTTDVNVVDKKPIAILISTPKTFKITDVNYDDTNGEAYFSTDGTTWTKYVDGMSVNNPASLIFKNTAKDPGKYIDSGTTTYKTINENHSGTQTNIQPDGFIVLGHEPVEDKFSTTVTIPWNESSISLKINDLFENRINYSPHMTLVIEVGNNHKYSYNDTKFVGAASVGFHQFSDGAHSKPIFTNTENLSILSPIKLTNTSTSADAKIHYTIGNSTSIPNPVAIAGGASDTRVYDPEVGISLIGWDGDITIKAITVLANQVSEVATQTFDADNFKAPPEPAISQIGSVVNPPTGIAYSEGDTILLVPPEGWAGEGEIYWMDTLPASMDALKNSDNLYSDSHRPVVKKPTQGSIMTLYAVFVSDVAKKNSEMEEFKIRLFSTMDVSGVKFNEEESVAQVSDNVLFTSFPGDGISDYLLADNVSSMNYEQASSADDLLRNNYPDADITITPSSGAIQEVANYISYERANDDDAVVRPVMKIYTSTTDSTGADFDSKSTTYTYPTREVVFTYDADDKVTGINVRYTNHQTIEVGKYLTDSSNQLYIHVQLQPSSDTSAYLRESEIKTFTFNKATTVGTLTMSPDPTVDTNTFNESSEITLTHTPPDGGVSGGVSIFYTINGGEPSVVYNPSATNDFDRWTPNNDNTKRYTDSFFLNTTTENTRINYKVVANNNQYEPTTGHFALTLDALPPAPAPVPHYENGATVISGEALFFYPDSALQNSQIYYTIGGGVPDPYAYLEYESQHGAVAPGEPVGGTYRYDASGIPANFPSGSSTLVIVAVVIDTKEQREYSTSPSVRVEYRIREAGTPTSLPSTDLNDIAVVEPGDSILLFSSTSNAQIFYTTDSTDPEVDITTNSSGVTVYTPKAGTTTQAYSSDNIPVMPSGTQSFFTIRAVAVSNDYSKSAEALLLFQPPEPVQAVSPSISPYQPIARNTPISFATTTENSIIMYKTYDSLSEAQADTAPLSATNGTLFNEELPIILTEDMVIRVVAERQSVQSAETFYEFTVAPQLKSPTMSLPSGSIIYPGAVISISNSGAGEIRYTTNGDDPKVADATDLLYGDSFVVTADYEENITVKVYTAATGYTDSETVVYNYTVVSEAGYITSTPSVESVVQGGSSINLSTTVSGGKIYYSTDSSLPTVNGTGGDSTESVTVEGNPGDTFTIKALVATDGATPGNIAVYNYIMAEKTPAPTANIPDGAIYLDGAAVTLTSKEGSIFYTLDGNDPTTSSALYQAPITLTGESVTLKAIAVLDESENSDVVTYNYTRAGDTDPPTFSQNGGTIETGYALSITTSTQGAQIYYSTDGTEPTTLNIDDLFLYTEPIVITKPVTVKAIAVSEQQHMSPVVEAYFLVAEPQEEEEEGHTGNPIGNTSFDGLQSRRDYDGTEGGPTYQENILSDELNSVITSFPDAILEDGAEMTVISQNASTIHRDAVSELGMDVSKLYDVTFTKDNIEVTPTGEFEIGLPIEAGYENSEVVIVRMNEDGTITTFPVRRSGGMVYAMVDGPGLYSVAVSGMAQESGGGVFGWFDDFLKWLRLLF